MLNRNCRSYWRSLKLGLLVLVTLTCALQSYPVWGLAAQYAEVTVDSRPVFRVADAGQLKASERSEAINEQLRLAVDSERVPQVKLEVRNKLPVVSVNERYLLTVTQNDTLDGQTPPEQAKSWVNRLQAALVQARYERSGKFLQEMTLFAVGIIATGCTLHWLLGKIWYRLRHLVGRLQSAETEGEPQAINLLFKSTLLLARITLWTSAGLYIANLFPLTRQLSYALTTGLIASLTNPIYSRGTTSYSVSSLVLLLVLLLGTTVLASTLTTILRTRVLQAMGLSRGAEASIAKLVKYAVIIIGALVVLQLWGIDFSSLAILASAFGVALGFGFQGIIKDFGSGLILLFERPIQVGDFVEVNGYKGIVEQINFRSTVINTLDRVSIVVPNSQFIDKEVINWSYRNAISRLHLPVGVAYGSDVNLVKSTLIAAVRSHAEVLPTPPPNVLFKGFGDSALEFDLMIWIKHPERQLLIKSDLYFAIDAAFRQQQIEIPFPQRDLHLRTGSLPVQLATEIDSTILALNSGHDRQQSSADRSE